MGLGVRLANETYRKSTAMMARTTTHTIRDVFFGGIRTILGHGDRSVNQAWLRQASRPRTAAATVNPRSV